MNSIARYILVASLLFFSLGCGPSVWERSFTPEPGIHPVEPTTAAVVREAPWGRVGAVLEAESTRLVESDIHRDDWTPDQARESEAALLDALQLPVSIEYARLIGRSHFKTTSRVNPRDAALATFAQSLGADYAIWSSRVLGKVETVEREAVWTDRWRWDRVWDDDRRRYEYVRRWQPETVWVPVVIERDEVRWVVFYVRRD